MSIGFEDRDLDRAMKYGDIPNGLLLNKFEESSFIDNQSYDDYARQELVDRTPDAPLFEYEESRFGNNDRINLQYGGKRGTADVNHSEMFLGETDTDPRGVALDPNMQKYVDESSKRTKFVNWKKENSKHIPSGNRSAGQVSKDIKKINKSLKHKMKFFDTQRTNLSSKIPNQKEHKPAINDIKRHKAYGETPNGTNYINKIKSLYKELRNDSDYRKSTIDGKFKTTKHYILRKQQTNKINDSKKSLNTAKLGNDGQYVPETADKFKKYKTCAMLMNKICEGGKVSKKLSHNMNFDKSIKSEGNNRAKQVAKENLMFVLNHKIKELESKDSQFAKHIKSNNHTLNQKSINGPSTKDSVHNHYVDPHTHNVSVVIKTVMQNDDLTKVQDYIITGTNDVFDIAKKSKIYQQNTNNTQYGSKLKHKEEQFDTHAVKYNSLIPVNYKKLHDVYHGDERKHHNAQFDYSSKYMPIMKPSNKNYKNPTTKDNVHMGEFFNNGSKDRIIAPMGNKRMNKFIDRHEVNDNDFKYAS